VASGQAIRIKSPNGNGTSFDFAEADHTLNGDNVFAENFKTASSQSSSVKNIALTVKGGPVQDMTWIVFRGQSVDAYDSFDAHKPRNPDPAPNIYSYATTGEKLAINSYGDFANTLTITVGFSGQDSTIYTISLNLAEVDVSWGDIYLYDHFTDTLHNLTTDGDYTFTHYPQVAPEKRFQVQFDTVFPTITSGNANRIFESSPGTVYTATADESVTFTLGSSGDEALFNMLNENDQGLISFKSAPDFGNPQDIGGDNNYELAVIATDGAGNSDTSAVTITVIPTPTARLSGNEGFRMLAVPSSGTILDEFLEPLWTQGMTGADTPNGDPNVWVWNEAADTAGNWTAVTDLSGQPMTRGQGFMMWVYSDDDFDGTPEGFPKMLNTINIFSSAVVDTGAVTPVDDLGDGRFFLVGNPYPSTMDWDSASVAKTSLSNAIYIWDDANTAWQTWNGSIGNIAEGRIEPLQSFFVQALDGTGKLTIGQGAWTDSVGTFFKQLPGHEPKALKMQAEAGGKKTEAWLSFQEGGQLERDKYDGLYLQPLTAEFLKLGTIISSGEILQINALPVDRQEQLVIPLDLSGSIEASRARLTFEGLEAFEGWRVSLRDTHTGKEFVIEENTTTELEVEPIRVKLKQPVLPMPTPMKAKTTGSRYQIVVTPGASVHNEPDPRIPSRTELQQNYPNPFNPATTIQFGVPTQGDVRLEVFDMLGRKVAELLNRPMQPGRYSVNFDASALSSGVYMYRLQTGSKSLTQKMTLIK